VAWKHNWRFALRPSWRAIERAQSRLETDLHPAKQFVGAMKFLKQFPAGQRLCFGGNIQPDFIMGVVRKDEAARPKGTPRFNREVNMKAIKNAALAMLALAIPLTSGCGRHSTKEVYYLIASDMALPYWQIAAAGFNDAAAQYKVTARVAGPDGHDPQAELDALHKAIAAKPAGILISVADVVLLQPEIDKAIGAGIPVITMDSDAPGSRRLYFIGTNNLEAGRLGGLRVIQKLGGKGNVVFFTLASQANTEERLKGFKEVFATRPDIHIVEVVDIKGDTRKAFDWTQEALVLTGSKRVDAFVSLESASSLAVADALKRANTNDRLLVAWDVDPDTLEGIKAGTIDSTVAQKPYTMAYIGLKALDEVFHAPPGQLGKDYSANAFAPYPIFVDTGTSLVDKTKVDLYITAATARTR
jgi:ribose transport system substrate-binding protein